MSSDILQKIIEDKRVYLKQKKNFLDTVRQNIEKSSYSSYRIFKECVSRAGQVNLIAEVKKASPSKGVLREDFQAVDIAAIYAQNGAAAISVLTEEKYFLGKPAYLRQVADAVSVPVLMKDFILEENQLFEARLLGASAVLLIAAILTDNELKALFKKARELDLDALVEVHTREELARAVDAGADVIGINNRNLTTFHVDLSVCDELVPAVPKGAVIIAESGIKTHEDLKRLGALGVHAVLIGEAFMLARDIKGKMREIMHGQ